MKSILNFIILLGVITLVISLYPTVYGYFQSSDTMNYPESIQNMMNKERQLFKMCHSDPYTRTQQSDACDQHHIYYMALKGFGFCWQGPLNIGFLKSWQLCDESNTRLNR